MQPTTVSTEVWETAADTTHKQTSLEVDLKLLHDFLRLPASVSINSVKPHPTDPSKCLLDVTGYFPMSGNITADYEFQDIRNVVFKGFRAA